MGTFIAIVIFLGIAWLIYSFLRIKPGDTFALKLTVIIIGGWLIIAIFDLKGLLFYAIGIITLYVLYRLMKNKTK